MNTQSKNRSRVCRHRKFTDARLVKLHSRGLSIPKLAKCLGVSQQPVRKRMKKLHLKANGRRGGVPLFKKVGCDAFKCRSCKKVKPLHRRNGTCCHDCSNKHWMSTKEGAIRFRYSMKKSVARRKGIEFDLTLDEYKRLYEKQAGRDGYTGQQMSFDFGKGRSRKTASLDRIDNKKGYTPGNVVFCRLSTNGKKGNRPLSWLAEQLKFDFSGEVNDASLAKSREETNPEK